jgi:hypothetical protein
MPDFKYLNNRSGAKVVKDFERVLTTGDVEKITPGLYHALTMHGGFIAHFDLPNFRRVFRDDLTSLLRGEIQPLTDPDRFRWPALEDSGYKDGLSAGDVMRMIARIGARMKSTVELRESEARKLAEVAALQSRYGVTHDVAQALVYGKRLEVIA